MRLLQLMAGAPHGGAEKFFERLAIALHEQGIAQHLLIRPCVERQRKLMRAGLTVDTAAYGGLFDLVTRRRIRELVKTFQPSAVLTWMNRASRHCPALSVPVVARLGGYYDLKYYRRADWLVGNTPDLVDYFHAKGWPAGKARFLPNFPEEPAPRPHRMLNTGGTITLLAMGRLHPNKAFDTLLAALSLLPVNFRLILAGSGDEENALRQQASAGGISNRVEFCGWQDDTAPLWGRADIFVCPSRHEPLGNVMQEAMANRVPIVATATDGTTLLLKHERSALVVPVDDSKAMAAAIQRYPQEPLLAQQCVEAAFTLWQAKYSKAAVVQQYKTFLQEITS